MLNLFSVCLIVSELPAAVYCLPCVYISQCIRLQYQSSRLVAARNAASGQSGAHHILQVVHTSTVALNSVTEYLASVLVSCNRCNLCACTKFGCQFAASAKKKSILLPSQAPASLVANSTWWSWLLWPLLF